MRKLKITHEGLDLRRAGVFFPSQSNAPATPPSFLSGQEGRKLLTKSSGSAGFAVFRLSPGQSVRLKKPVPAGTDRCFGADKPILEANIIRRLVFDRFQAPDWRLQNVGT
jgi:hypothetical protein